MFGDDLGNIFLLNHRVKSSFRIYDHDGAEGAQSETTGLDNTDFFRQPVGRDFFFQSLTDTLASGRGASGSAADEYM